MIENIDNAVDIAYTGTSDSFRKELKKSIKYILCYSRPEDLFDKRELRKWALQNGFVEQLPKEVDHG